MWDVGTAGMYFIMLLFDASVLICWPQFAPEQVMCLSKPRSPPSFHSNTIQNTLHWSQIYNTDFWTSMIAQVYGYVMGA